MFHQSKYDSIPHSGDTTLTPGTIVFRNGKIVARIETVTTITTEDDTPNRAAEFSAGPEVDSDDGPTKPLYTPPADRPNRIDLDEIEQECLDTHGEAVQDDQSDYIKLRPEDKALLTLKNRAYSMVDDVIQELLLGRIMHDRRHLSKAQSTLSEVFRLLKMDGHSALKLLQKEERGLL